MNKILKYILLTPIHIMIKDIFFFIARQIKKEYKKRPIFIIIAGLSLALLFFLSNPIFLSENNPDNKNIAFYPHWYIEDNEWLNQNDVKADVENEIIKETNNYDLLNIFKSININDDVFITQNEKNNNIYIIDLQNYTGTLSVYKNTNKNLVLIKKVWFFHLYRVGSADYDEENGYIYLGVLGWDPNEGNLSNHTTKGYDILDEKKWIKINNILKRMVNNNE